MIRVRSGQATHVGQVRAVNQDSSLVRAGGPPSDDHTTLIGFDTDTLAMPAVYAVADGMGGHRGGEVASAVALDTLADRFAVASTDALVHAVEEANRAVLARAELDRELHGMGTTLTAVAIVGAGPEQVFAIANVGDSRTYRLVSGELELLTDDHTVVAELVRTGQLTPEQAAVHRQRSVLTRALGVEGSLEVDVLEVVPRVGERYLLCSDGLTGEVTDSMIAAVLRRLHDPAEAAQELVRLAVEHGGRDNVTAVVLDVVDDAAPADGAGHFAAARHDATSDESSSSRAPIAAAVAPVVVRYADDDRTVVRAPSEPSTAPLRRRDRDAPRLISARTIVFVVALAGIAAVAAWAVRAGRDTTRPTTTVVSTVSASVPDSTSVPDSAVGASPDPSAVVGSSSPITGGTDASTPTSVAPGPAASDSAVPGPVSTDAGGPSARVGNPVTTSVRPNAVLAPTTSADRFAPEGSSTTGPASQRGPVTASAPVSTRKVS